jgi:hypothetical protein
MENFLLYMYDISQMKSNLRLDRVCILCNNRNIYTRIFAAFARKRNRNLDVLAYYNKTRINIDEDHQHDRRMELKEALRVQTHAEVC